MSLVLSGSLSAAESQPDKAAEQGARFANVFGDHMVLQRGQAVQVWGQAAANERVTVTLAGNSATAKADSDGNWKAELPALPAGGPFDLTLSGAGDSQQTISDVLLGDVWLCSGQSNMEYTAGELNQFRSPSLHTPSTIRLMTIAKASDAKPRTELGHAAVWSVAEPESIHEFSAVCFRLAYELQKRHDIPFGMISSSWGGSGIKAWIGADALKLTGNYDEPLGWLNTYASDRVKANRDFGEAWENWWSEQDVADRNPAGVEPWNEPANSKAGWQNVPAGMGDWKEFGDPALADHLGMVWYRQSFELDSGQAGQSAVLAIGGVDEVDYLWVNGEFVGTTFGWGDQRFYKLPADMLKKGVNTVTVNVLNTWAAGGMTGPAENIELKLSNNEVLALGEGWSYRKVPAAMGSPLRSPWESIGGLSGLTNAMIAPLEGFNLTGAIWYQGETDAGDPAPYEQLLASLTYDWRQRFGESLPVLVVQLPNFGPMPTAPVESGWAAIRDAQQKVAIAEENTGLVVTVDLGDKYDLHPPDKRGIGKRAAGVADILAYGQSGIADGIAPESAYQIDDQVLLEFEQDGEKLVVLSSATPMTFELCGDASDSCVFANARLEDNLVTLDAKGFGKVTHVRHCWADAPVCNLYGESGLPVSSFDIPVSAQR